MSSNQFRVRPDSQELENKIAPDTVLKSQIDPQLFSVTSRLLSNQALIDLDLFNLYYNFWATVFMSTKLFIWTLDFLVDFFSSIPTWTS